VSSDKHDPLIEEYLRETEWMEHEPLRPCFEHTFIPKDASQVLQTLAKVELSGLPAIPGIWGAVASKRERFRIAICNEGTLLWHLTSGLAAAPYLSKALDCTVHWLAVNEEITSRAYARFSKGHLDPLFRDPVIGFEKNLWDGDDLIGKGIRQYESLSHFLEAVEPFYSPKDRYWYFERWAREKDEEEMQIAEGEWKAVERCITVTYGDPIPPLEPTGEWSQEEFEEESRELLKDIISR
jgi:hypothetical protein